MKVGRPKKGEKREVTKDILFRATAAQKKRYRARAKQLKMSLSAWIRETLDGACK